MVPTTELAPDDGRAEYGGSRNLERSVGGGNGEDVFATGNRRESALELRGGSDHEGRQQSKRRRTKTKMTVASLNMRGYSGEGERNHNKWLLINQLVRD